MATTLAAAQSGSQNQVAISLCSLVKTLQDPRLITAMITLNLVWGAWLYYAGGKLGDLIIRTVVFAIVIMAVGNIVRLITGSTAC